MLQNFECNAKLRPDVCGCAGLYPCAFCQPPNVWAERTLPDYVHSIGIEWHSYLMLTHMDRRTQGGKTVGLVEEGSTEDYLQIVPLVRREGVGEECEFSKNPAWISHVAARVSFFLSVSALSSGSSPTPPPPPLRPPPQLHVVSREFPTEGEGGRKLDRFVSEFAQRVLVCGADFHYAMLLCCVVCCIFFMSMFVLSFMFSFYSSCQGYLDETQPIAEVPRCEVRFINVYPSQRVAWSTASPHHNPHGEESEDCYFIEDDLSPSCSIPVKYITDT